MMELPLNRAVERCLISHRVTESNWLGLAASRYVLGPNIKFFAEHGVRGIFQVKNISCQKHTLFYAIHFYTKNDQFTKTGSGQTLT
eukprot:COSAG06_NODE_2441_length_6871_cov_9.359716_5_plen_86_part_00